MRSINTNVVSTCSFQLSDSLQLLDDGGEGVGDDRDHDEDGEQENE